MSLLATLGLGLGIDAVLGGLGGGGCTLRTWTGPVHRRAGDQGWPPSPPASISRRRAADDASTDAAPR